MAILFNKKITMYNCIYRVVGLATALEREGRIGHVDAGGQFVIGQDVNLKKKLAG